MSEHMALTPVLEEVMRRTPTAVVYPHLQRTLVFLNQHLLPESAYLYPEGGGIPIVHGAKPGDLITVIDRAGRVEYQVPTVTERTGGGGRPSSPPPLDGVQR
jgi:hypothetical protein